MTSTGNMFADIIQILPIELECRYRAHGFNKNLLDFLQAVKGADSTIVMSINDENREKITNWLLSSLCYYEIEHIEIYHNDKLLFEAFDGFDGGQISHTVTIPEWFKKADYFKGSISVAEDW